MSANQYLDLMDKLKKLSNYDVSKLSSVLTLTSKLDESWSGSFIGYQSRVYYNGLQKPPTGAVFNKDWGFNSPFQNLGGYLTEGMKSIGDWVEYDPEQITDYILNKCDLTKEDLLEEIQKANEVSSIFNDLKSDALSLYYSQKKNLPPEDKFLEDLVSKIENSIILSEKQILSVFLPKQVTSSDNIALQEGIRVPPHINLRVRVAEVIGAYSSCNELHKNIEKLYKHINNLEGKMMREKDAGINIFIGHGKSKLWLELKDFIKDKLHQPYDEFNRVSIAGVTNITRLNQMLEQAAFAFILMTAEDETQEGKVQARMNVIHEAGLFQGKLGFERAIILLEDGCEEFSNINGLGQIRFPKGNISAVFQQIREVLERENVIEG